MHRHSLPLIAMLLIMLVTCAVVHAAERCNRCGREIGQDWRFCAYCGVPLEPLTPTERPWESPGTRAGQEIIGPDGGTMVWVPPGEFVMGSDDRNDRAEPMHPVRLTRGFWLGKLEVTRAQHRRFCEAMGLPFPDDDPERDEHVLVHTSWDDAVAYCEHYGLRLPTEAEWEFAARGPGSWPYPWGFVWTDDKCSCMRGGGYTPPHRGGRFPAGASWCGALDMAGHVAEWCADWFDPDYYSSSPVEDPPGPETGASRVVRGGSFSSRLEECRSSHRGAREPSHRGYNTGFRVASTP
ncbi:MAG TPA: hypothetical protein DGT21_01580 [Armatimonadetes bacterium]|nr:hypothetical protein [Armatimonadota bacterium]